MNVMRIFLALAAAAFLSLLPSQAADTTPPTVLSVNPALGSMVSNLSQITIIFSEPVVGVQNWNLQINGNDADTLSSVGSTNFTFGFTQPLPGAIPVAWDPTQAITDDAGNVFATSSAWQYTLADVQPPTLLLRTPAAGATVGNLNQVGLTFNEPVLGVDAADLLVNGQPAANVSGSGAGPYIFQFSPPPLGTVSFSWNAGNGITDLASNPLAADTWNVTLAANAVAPTVRINEFLAANVATNGLRDEDGDLEGWIELYNYGSTAVNLTGYSLSSSPGDPGQWVFPAANLAAGQYVLVFASAKDRRVAGANLHTSFNLNPDGDYLGFFNAESPPVALTEFSPQYPSQRNDYSYGLNPSSQWRYYATPTPKAANGDSAISGVLPPVHFSVERGFFNAPFNLVLTEEIPGASIIYTTDGSQPTLSNGLLYTNALTLSHLTVLRAAAFMTNVLSSVVQTHSFMFLDDVIHQSQNQPGVYTNLWGSVAPDFEMDPKVVTNQAYAGTIKNDLLSIPTMSITLKPDDMFGAVNGIYTHSDASHVGPAWTRACSVEFINPDGKAGFQLDAAIKIHGGGSREQSKEKKHPLALGFKSQYGPSKLQYPLFPDSPVAVFNDLILRAEYNNHWTHELDNLQRARATMVRDEWFKDTMTRMGSFSSHGIYVHLYINGLYWGVYNPCEHHDAAFAASYLGGNKSEYDAVAAGDTFSVLDGNLTARNTLLSIAAGGLANPAQYELLKQNLDITQYADYMILLLYGANLDWGNQKNWTALRRRVPGARWLYMTWDDERTFEDVNAAVSSFTSLSPDNLQTLMSVNPEYRLAFGDRVHRHFFNNGAMTTNAIVASWKARAAQVDRAMVGESARWGDMNPKTAISPAPYVGYTNNAFYTHDDDWVGYENWLLSSYFPIRSSNVLNQFRALGLYPSTAAPSLSQFGGRVPSGYQLYLTNNAAAGTIYYTTNGADPRVYGSGAVSPQAIPYANGVPVGIFASQEVQARTLSGTNWSALVDATFLVAQLIPPLRITELMYAPQGGDTYEFIELQNVGATPVNAGNFSFIGITFTFPPGTIINPGDRVVLASNNNTNSWKTRYPGVAVAGWYGGKLSNTGERIALLDAHLNVITAVNYSNTGGWPAAAGGGGYSLEVIDPNGDPDDPANWQPSAALNGTPGLANSTPVPPTILLNELMADNRTAVNNGGAYPDWVELFNPGAADKDLGNWSLSQNGHPGQYVFPSGTIIPAGGYLVVWCDTNSAAPGLHTGFTLSRLGDELFLFDPNASRIDAVSFGSQIADGSLGRIGGIWKLTTPTPGTANVATALAASTNLWINEWLANSPPGGSDWVELFNQSSDAPVALRNIYLGTSNDLFQIKSYAFVPPRGYVQLLADQLPGLGHLDFKIHGAGDAIILYDESGAELSRVTFGGQAQSVTQGRLPDGSANIVSFPGTASPAASNYVSAYTGPYLNEVLARNFSAVTNSDGRVADYIELYNPYTTNFVLAGMSLSVDAPLPRQWVFPPGTTISGQGYLLIWCDGSLPASTGLQANLNTGHSIDSHSGGVYLFNSLGQLLDLVELGFQIQDLPIGKSGGIWRLLSSATPGAANSAPAVLGPASGLRINEWMASPLSGDDWFEIYNSGSAPASLNGLYLTDDPSLVGQTNSVAALLSFIGGHGFVKWIADNSPSKGRDHVGFNLASLGETIRLYDTNLSLIDAVDFGIQIDGVSQGRLPDGSPNIVSFPATPTPELSNYLPLPNALINEALTHAASPLEGAIEIYNPTAAPAAVGGWFLSDSADNFKKYRIPNGTTLSAGGFLVVYENQFNANNPGMPFALNPAHGGAIWLSAADGAGSLTGYRVNANFGAAETNVSFGSYQTSVGVDFTALSAHTFGVDNPASVQDFRAGTGLPNAAPKIGPVIINELMYHPPDVGGTNNTLDEYIELYNASGASVAMYDPAYPTNRWRLQGGVDFTFTNTSIPASGYAVVVSFDPVANPAQLAAFQSRYSLSPSVPIYGPYSGSLADGGETIELAKPDVPQPAPDTGFVPYISVDRVSYSDSLPWPSGADGNSGGIGLSLQRKSPSLYGNEPLNWVAAYPAPGAANGPPFVSLPVITQQPQSTGGVAGVTFTFNVAATTTSPLAYQWRVNGLNIPGATNAQFAILNAQSTDQGSYTVFVSNPAGSVLSAGATLAIAAPPQITQQPQTQVATPGATVSFSVLANGAGLTYQWRFNGTNIAGATNALLTLTNVQISNAGAYSVAVINGFSPAISDNAYLVIAPPAITLQPQSQTNYVGSPVTFTVAASGDLPFSYQWSKNGNTMSAPNNASFTIANLQTSDSGGYSVVVANPVGSVTSVVANLTVVIPLLISQQPTNVVTNPGSNVTFSVTASGSGTVKYQWRLNGTNITNNPSAATASLLLTNVQLSDNGSYSAVLMDDVSTVFTTNATLIVKVRPAILQQPTGVTVAAGSTVSLSLSLTGTLPITNSWRRGGSAADVVQTDVLTNSSVSVFKLTNIQPSQGTNYRVASFNIAGAAVALSSNAFVTVVIPPTNQTAVAGSTVTFNASVTGAAAPSYRWQFNGADIAGATGNSLSLTNIQATNAGNYSLVVTVVTNAPIAPATFTASLNVLINPILGQPQFLPDGKFQLLLQGNANRSYFIDTSSNLTSWSNLATVVYTNGQTPFIDATATNRGQRFYRARLAP